MIQSWYLFCFKHTSSLWASFLFWTWIFLWEFHWYDPCTVSTVRKTRMCKGFFLFRTASARYTRLKSTTLHGCVCLIKANFCDFSLNFERILIVCLFVWFSLGNTKISPCCTWKCTLYYFILKRQSWDVILNSFILRNLRAKLDLLKWVFMSC